MPEVAAILLAAGLSRRMGARNKLLLPINGKPMVRRVAEAYLDVMQTPLTVVTGFEADKIRAALEGLNAVFVHNANFADGQPGSVATGLKVAPQAELLLIGLADQPLLTARDIGALLTAHMAGDPDKITIPTDGARRGNPIVIPRTLQPRLTENPDRPGCMRFTRDFPEHVQHAPMQSAGFYDDIDTPEEFSALTASQEGALN